MQLEETKKVESQCVRDDVGSECALGMAPTEEDIATAMKAMANAKAVGPDGLPAELLKLGLQQDWTILLELYRLDPHLARGESPTAVERRGHYYTPQEGRQDGVRKLPRHLARVTRG